MSIAWWRGSRTPAARAGEVFGSWMVTPEAVERQLGVTYAARQRRRLAQVPWPDAVLAAAADDWALFPGYPLTIVELCGRAHSSLLAPDDARQLRGRRFARRVRAEPRWHLIRRHTRQAGAGTYNDHRRALAPEEMLPRAVEVAFMIVLFERAAQVRLFADTVVHCADRSEAGYHAGVGWGGVGSWADGAAYPATHFRLQLAPARKPFR